MLTQGVYHVYIKQRMYMCIHLSKLSSKQTHVHLKQTNPANVGFVVVVVFFGRGLLWVVKNLGFGGFI